MDNGELWICDRKMFNTSTSECLTVGLPNVQCQIKDSTAEVGTVDYLTTIFGLKHGESMKLELREFPKENG